MKISINQSFIDNYNKYLTIAYTLSKAKYGNTDIAEDIMHDVYCYAIATEHNIKVDDPFIYIIKIMKNQLFNQNSPTNKLYPQTEEIEDNEDIDDDDDSEYREILFRLIDKKIEEINLRLAKIYWFNKKIFELYYFTGLSYRQIEAKTNIPRQSVYNAVAAGEKLIDLRPEEKEVLIKYRQFIRSTGQ